MRLALILMGTPASWPAESRPLVLDTLPTAQFRLDGVIGQRVAANERNWLLRAPAANPGLTEMFRWRDRQPAPELVPWAGEFVGKYLISAVGAMRLSGSTELSATVRQVVVALVNSQSVEGYLGPFPSPIRLKGNWDLWGHYHCMLGLLLWYEATGDETARRACRRAADLICRTFLDGDLRVIDAGSPEMNMAVIHVFGRLYRATNEPRYLEFMRHVEKDWEKAGDYFRTGVAGVEFYRTPRPRWESLHDLQGLLELYLITGEADYARALQNHWRSILVWDRRNTGGFSSGEQATGNPYAPTAIETCCSVAWMALTLDALRLTGDSGAADELELTLFNAAAGAQHPSGSWWTYDTPMDGKREASAHTIVFQARAGTPELNCCSVNGPRALGMLSEWAVMGSADGLAVNFYGPGRFQGKLPDNTPIGLEWKTSYPESGSIQVRVEPVVPRTFTLRFRIPRWAAAPTWRLNDQNQKRCPSGAYLDVRRVWKAGDRVQLEFGTELRAVVGAQQAAGKVSLYRGPLLLAYEQRFNSFDELDIPSVDLRRLPEAALATPTPASGEFERVVRPWLVLDLPAAEGQVLRLCDFASAGATGARYRSWLTATNCPPSPAMLREPRPDATLGPGPIEFRWSGGRPDSSKLADYRLEIYRSASPPRPVLKIDGISRKNFVLTDAQASSLLAGGWYYWRVISRNSHGSTESVGPMPRFQVDPALQPNPIRFRPEGDLLIHAFAQNSEAPRALLKKDLELRSVPGPTGELAQAITWKPGRQAQFELDEFPDDFTVAVWVKILAVPAQRLGQVFSAWAGPMDDPLRICIDGGKLFARVEAGRSYSTGGSTIEPQLWHHIAAVKHGPNLRLYLDGQEVSGTLVPESVTTASARVALGGNPSYTGADESLEMAAADFRFYGRGLPLSELLGLARR